MSNSLFTKNGRNIKKQWLKYLAKEHWRLPQKITRWCCIASAKLRGCLAELKVLVKRFGIALHGVCIYRQMSLMTFVAVQNERDRISVRRTTYDDIGQNGSLSVNSLLNAELLSRQVPLNSILSQTAVGDTSERFFLANLLVVAFCTGNLFIAAPVCALFYIIITFKKFVCWRKMFTRILGKSNELTCAKIYLETLFYYCDWHKKSRKGQLGTRRSLCYEHWWTRCCRPTSSSS